MCTDIINIHRNLPVFDLNRPSEWKNQESIFKYASYCYATQILITSRNRNFNWNSSKANVLFDYLRYDRVANGPSDLENFQVMPSIVFPRPLTLLASLPAGY